MVGPASGDLADRPGPGDPEIISAEEDIRLAFAVAGGWLLVCETSALLVSDSQVVSRLAFGDVLLAARWEGSRLLVRDVVRDASGQDITVIVHGGRLAIAR